VTYGTQFESRIPNVKDNAKNPITAFGSVNDVHVQNCYSCRPYVVPNLYRSRDLLRDTVQCASHSVTAQIYHIV